MHTVRVAAHPIKVAAQEYVTFLPKSSSPIRPWKSIAIVTLALLFFCTVNYITHTIAEFNKRVVPAFFLTEIERQRDQDTTTTTGPYSDGLRSFRDI